MADKLLLDGEPVLAGRFAAASQRRVLVVVADAARADVIARRLRAEGYGAATADAMDAALRACQFNQPDLLLLD